MIKNVFRFVPALLLILASCGEAGPAASKAADSTVAATTAAADSLNSVADEEVPPPGASAKADSYDEKDFSNLPASLKAFVTAGYTVMDTATGDLNRDQYTDMIMVLKINGEDSIAKASEQDVKRPLLVLLGQADGTYKQAASSNNAVLCAQCGGMMGDPYQGIVIKNGYFSLENYGGAGMRWTRTITFKYSAEDKNWFLHKDGGSSFHATEPDKETTEVKTTKDFGKVSLEQFSAYHEKE